MTVSFGDGNRLAIKGTIVMVNKNRTLCLRHFPIKFSLKFQWRLVAQFWMCASAVIKSQIINNTELGCLLSFRFFVIQLLMLKTTKKSLCGRIIPTVALSAHTLFHLHDIQVSPIFLTGILTASIWVMKQAGLGFSPPKGHSQGTDTQWCPHMISHCPTHDLPGK